MKVILPTKYLAGTYHRNTKQTIEKKKKERKENPSSVLNGFSFMTKRCKVGQMESIPFIL